MLKVKGIKSPKTRYNRNFQQPFPWSLPPNLTHLPSPAPPQVTVAVIPPEGAAAKVWQVYQVAPGMEKRLLPAGRWLQLTPEADEELALVRGQWRSPDRLEERKVTFGRMLGVVGDPLLRRADLSGLRLICTTVHVRHSGPQHTDALNTTAQVCCAGVNCGTVCQKKQFT